MREVGFPSPGPLDDRSRLTSHEVLAGKARSGGRQPALDLVQLTRAARDRARLAAGRQPRRHASSRVAPTSHQQRPGWSGGAVPCPSARTQPCDDPGKRAAKASG